MLTPIILNFNPLYSSREVKSPLPAQNMQLYPMGNQEVCTLDQGSATHSPCANSGSLHVSQNKFLLAFSNAHLFPYCLWLLLQCSGRDHVAHKALTFAICLFYKECRLTPISCWILSPSASMIYIKYFYQIRIWFSSCAKHRVELTDIRLSFSLLFFFSSSSLYFFFFSPH